MAAPLPLRTPPSIPPQGADIQLEPRIVLPVHYVADLLVRLTVQPIHAHRDVFVGKCDQCGKVF